MPLEFQDGRAFYDGAHDSVVFEGVDGANKDPRAAEGIYIPGDCARRAIVSASAVIEACLSTGGFKKAWLPLRKD